MDWLKEKSPAELVHVMLLEFNIHACHTDEPELDTYCSQSNLYIAAADRLNELLASATKEA